MRDLLAILDLPKNAPRSEVLSRFLDSQTTKHPALGGTTSQWLDLYWSYLAWLDQEVYEVAPAAWQEVRPRPTDVLDWRAVAITEVCAYLDEAFRALPKGGTSALQIADRAMLVEPYLKYLPVSWDCARLVWYAGPPHELVLDDEIRALCALPELQHLHHARWAITWRAKEKKQHGRRVLGTCKPLGERERAEWPTQPSPHFRLEFDFAYWMAACTFLDPVVGWREARTRLLHHELGHAALSWKNGQAKGRSIGHDVEEMGATLERFGTAWWGEALALQKGAANQRTLRALEVASGAPQTFLTRRDAKGEPDMRAPILTVSAAGFARTVGRCRTILEAERPDVGAGPWAEMRVALDYLHTIDTPDPGHLAQLQMVRDLLARWTGEE